MKTGEQSSDSHKIAIVGMACRLPGASNIREYWNNLVNEVESITQFTVEDLRESGVDEAVINSPNYVRARGIMGGASAFDAAFFGITPRDAEIMDPQHRIFLECAWHALEDAAYDPAKTEARIGVYGGTGVGWHLNSVVNNPDSARNASGTSIVTGNDKDYLATRVSYKLNLTGPSVTVQCACSTSMVAVVMGVNSLLSYQCDMVLAGGATIELPEKQGYMYQEGGIDSSDGKCRTFDKDADGTVFSRGAAVVLLKRYEDALADGDHIHAVILGGAINNDGSNKVGYTAPSVQGQADVAIEAMELAGITADTVSCVEAHGTATSVGDPIEVASLTQCFRAYTDKKEFCAIGSVKTNIGHTDSASGVASLIKMALALKHKKIPAHLNYKVSNPKIDFPNSPFYVNTATKNWETRGYPRRALVNSFGVGGTNACVILEEVAERKSGPETASIKTLVFSAKTETALENLQRNLHGFLEERPDINLDDLAYTYQTGRKAFQRRAFLSFRDRNELLEKLSAEGTMQSGICETDDKPVIFMFPGQGNQYHRMGADLYAGNPLFRETVDKCADFLQQHFGFDLRHYLYAQDDPAAAKAALEKTRITQPAIFTISYAMAQVVMEMGVKPEALIGHSVGEYVAACISGIMSLEDALLAVATRGALIQDLPGGAMLAVLQNEDKILPLLFPGVEVAAVNNPGLTVVAGSNEDIDKLEGILNAGGFFSKRLSTSHAFHSAMMEPCLPEFGRFFEKITLSAPEIPIISTVTGRFLSAEEAMNPDYWVGHVRNTVRFTDAVKHCLEMNPVVFFEVGPGQSLESAVKRHLEKGAQHAAVRGMHAETENADDNYFLANALGNLWMSGAAIDWTQYYEDQARMRLSLPCYPYDREVYSIDFSKVKSVKAAKTNTRFKDPKDWYSVPVWKRSADIKYLANANGEVRTWLLLQDHSGLGYAMVNTLLDLHQIVFEVYPGEHYERQTENKFVIDIANKDHYERLVKELADGGANLQNVVHLLNYAENDGHALDAGRLELAEVKGYLSPLYLQQALYNNGKLKEIQFSIVGNGAFNVLGEGVDAPEKALCMGPARVLIQEFPKARSRYIDVDFQKTEHARAQLAEKIIRETNNKKYETLVAYRNNYRWIEGYQRFPLESSGSAVYRQNGVYLITGGMGGIGILTAKAIATQVNATFILTYNSPFMDRKDWDKYLEENPEDIFTRLKIDGVRELEKLGSKVVEVQVNVADYEGMERIIREMERQFGIINGVVHSAGAAGGGVLPLKTAESSRPVLDSKFRGVVALDRLFAGHQLDFFILYSSVAAILGESTRIDYCSGNAFIDAMAHYRKNRLNDRSMSINWPGWKGAGMAVRWEKEKADKANKMKNQASGSALPEPAALEAKTTLRDAGNMLRTIRQNENQWIVELDYQPENDWITNSHFIVGQPTVVGTSFIEMLHRLGEMIFPGQSTELNNLYFMSPLMFEGGRAKRVRIFAEKKNGKCKVQLRSQPMDKDPEKGVWHDHLMCELVPVEKSAPGRIDLELLRARLPETDEASFPHLMKNQSGMALVDLGERWKTPAKVYVGENEWLAHIRLKPEFSAQKDGYRFHPALLDRATSFAFKYLGDKDINFLPFSYSRILPIAAIPDEIMVHARLSGPKGKSDGVVSVDVSVTDINGNVLMEIREYSMKQVNEMPVNSRPNQASEADNLTAKLLTNAVDYIDPQQGEGVIRHLLHCDFPEQLVVYPCDFDFMLEDNLPDLQKREEEKEQAKREKKSYYVRPALTTPYVEPENEMEKTIAEIWQDILGIDKIGRNDTFTDLGGNSLLAIQTIANIADVLEVELSAQVFYENPTVKGLAEAVVSSIMDLDDIENLEDIIESMSLNGD